ncbi:MAG: hypothetical protein M0Z50_04885 [Planctomycetia bacterium]|nr:hypothetical protein [Planctomycetia bacterium]
MGILAPLKSLGKLLAPDIYWNLQRRYHRGLLRPVERAVINRYGLQVVAGPFSGMRYIGEATGSRLLPKLCGSYEAELFPVLDTAFARKYDRVVDVGCAEGYYAVGLARKFPGTRVNAYDTDESARRLCGELCRLNGVADLVRIGVACTPATLAEMAGERVLLVCDCEGYEFELLDNVTIGDLPRWDIIVELHEGTSDGIRTTSLCKRMAHSHDLEIIPSVPRETAAYPTTHFLPKRWQKRAVDEGRPVKQWWLWASARGI